MIECRSDHQRSTLYLAERPAKGPAGSWKESSRAENDRGFLSSEYDEGQLKRRSADKRKLEKLLKSGCKREEKNISLKKQQLEQDQIDGDLIDEQAGKLVKVKPAQMA
ncbi:putative LRR receptor-like serine/threonine-protein kinase-like [Dorcoceras hygrometricum]|uniref:Putative LRR receptor-like serine/threonine-protein kinase-like n=1 Tax=Dorcoceras hygrometricum TaxID=472368 RepID=A0A2Z7BU84_9LAMI|nr:putative LRR receptor-like serine/threonine-protein kinase-like [Dorcoceras hygrometricum]